MRQITQLYYDIIGIGDAPPCEICGSNKDVKCCPVMTGDDPDQPVKHPLCVGCIITWYEGGGTSSDEILKYRIKEGTLK